MTSRVNLTINGQKIEAHAAQTVLEVAQEHGIDIPTLCHHPALEPVGSCRMCLIEISRHQPLYPVCTYQVSEGLAVQTDSPRVESARDSDPRPGGYGALPPHAAGPYRWEEAGDSRRRAPVNR